MNNMRRMIELVSEINIISAAYYTLDNPTMSDKDYDDKYDELLALEKVTNTILDNSPTQRIGDVILKEYKKYTHQSPLWSLDKAQTNEELDGWIVRAEKFVSDYNNAHSDKLPPIKYILTKKYDGLTVNCTYDNEGGLINSATRGDGKKGEIVLHQSETIVNLPHRIDNNFEFEIHGEALMNKRAFKDYNNSLNKGEKPLKNLRNGAAGALRTLNIKETARRKLIAYMYDIGFSDGHAFETYIEMLDFIKEKGFPTADYTVCNNLEEIYKQIDIMNTERPTLQFDIDGIVIVIDDMKTRDLMGYTIKFPKWAIAKKFLAEEATTTLLKVDWNVGRTGKMCPTGILKPVNLMGSTVKRATLNNMDDIERKGVRIGSLIFIRKSGDVIPEVMGIVGDENVENTVEIKMLESCPSCGSNIVREGVHYYCKNTLSCKPQLIKNIVHFAEREAMNLEGISIKTIEKLMEDNIVNTVMDLYKLKERKEKILEIEGFAEKKFNNMLESIEKSRHCKFQSLIYALGIDGVGKKSSTDITKVFNSVEKLRDAKVDELLKIKDVGGITANSVITWFSSDKNIKLLEELLEYVIIEKEEVEEIIEGVFSGKSIYCTGTFASHTKTELKAIVKSLGGEFASGYNQKLSMLVFGSVESSTKVDKARKDGKVRIVTEDEFLEMIKG